MEQSVAVIIPTYNRAGCLPRALDSVLAQTRIPDQIIVVDDGSEDGTRQLIGEHYPGVTYSCQPNRGVSSARNRGVGLSHSRWLTFLDSDDEWLPRKLELQLLAAAVQPGYELVHCDETWIRNGRRVNPMDKHRKRGGDIFFDCLPRCVISPSAVMLTRSLFNRHGGFDESLPACEDYDLWLRICAGQKVGFVDRPLLKKYGGHGDQLSRRYWGMDRFRVRALADLLDRGELNGGQQARARAMLAKKCRILILGADKRGNTGLASRCRQLLARHAEGLPGGLAA